jgi:hypothetical protein
VLAPVPPEEAATVMLLIDAGDAEVVWGPVETWPGRALGVSIRTARDAVGVSVRADGVDAIETQVA